MKRGGKILVLLVSIFVIASLVFVSAYGTNPAGDVNIVQTFGHDGDEISINNSGEMLTLQSFVEQLVLRISELQDQVSSPSGDGIGNRNVEKLSMNYYGASTCALFNDGTVACTGNNAHGQLGIGDKTNRLKYNVVSSLVGVKEIKEGTAHSCAILNNGNVSCWGNNQYWQLGSGTTNVQKLTPTLVPGLWNVVDIALKEGIYINTYPSSSFALTAKGEVYAWGDSRNGQLGLGFPVAASAVVKTPTKITAINNATKIAVGGHTGGGHACVILGANGNNGGASDEGKVMCWGYNQYGQVGVANPTGKTRIDSPTIVPGVIAKDIAMTHDDFGTVCAILKGTDDGKIKCWGYNGQGQLGAGLAPGTGGVNSKFEPVSVIGGIGNDANTKAVKIKMSGAGGTTGVCALLANKNLMCWGNNKGYGKMGLGTDAYRHTPAQILSDVYDFELQAWGGDKAGNALGWGCAIMDSDKSLKCWGYNAYGQLGTGDKVSQKMPVSVPGFGTSAAYGGVSKITLGSAGNSCVVLNDKSVKCWGYNAYGQLGTGDSITALTPMQPI